MPRNFTRVVAIEKVSYSMGTLGPMPGLPTSVCFTNSSSPEFEKMLESNEEQGFIASRAHVPMSGPNKN